MSIAVAGNLATCSDHRSLPPEFLALSIREYRQSYFKPHRIIYLVIEKQVFIYLIADGRRDMKS